MLKLVVSIDVDDLGCHHHYYYQFFDPQTGRSLTAGLGGGTSSDTLDAHGGVNTLDFGRLNQLYNCLVEYKADGLLRLALAEEVTPSSKATTWTIRLREGVEFHNGKLLTADDIVYNFRRITNPKKPFTGAALIPAIADMKVLETCGRCGSSS